MEGHGIVEVLVREPAKGTTLEALRSSVGADAVVYLGDDVTDEDAFAVLGQDDLAISIGPTPTGAAFQVASPRSRGGGARPAGRRARSPHGLSETTAVPTTRSAARSSSAVSTASKG